MALTEKDKKDIAEIISSSKIDWRTNPIVYMIMMIVISVIISFIDNRISNDEDINTRVTKLEANCEKTLGAVSKLEESNSTTIKALNKFDKVLAIIRTKLAIEDDNKGLDDEEFQKLVEEYESETRGRKKQTSMMYQDNFPIYFDQLMAFNNIYMQK